LETDEQTAAEPTAEEPTAIEPTARGRGRSPSVAALLSFLWPGLGQLYLRNRRAAALFAVPPVFVLLLLAFALRRGYLVFAAQLLVDRNVGLATVALVLLVGGWRVAAVVHAFTSGERRPNRRILDKGLLAALVVVILVGHLGGGMYLMAYSNAGSQISGGGNKSLIQDPSGASLAPGQTPAVPAASPMTTPSIDHRVTIMLNGVDADPSRPGQMQYDSIVVVSYDPKTNSVQMVSVSRDTASYPLYFGGYAQTEARLTYMPRYVSNGWINSPETGSDRGYKTLLKEVQYLVGIPIDYYAVMEMSGFVTMIDMVGGITIDNPTAINDYEYDWLDGSPYGFYLAPGQQHLDGRHALAYVRSRRSQGENDFTRDGRQQQVLIALLHEMTKPEHLLNYPSLISALVLNTTTNFPANQVAEYMAQVCPTLDRCIPTQNVKQVVLSVGEGYSNYLHAVSGVPVNSSAVCLYNDKVAAGSIALFGQESLWYGKTPPPNICS
jgi:LCP family protein required for cell wall assembly